MAQIAIDPILRGQVLAVAGESPGPLSTGIQVEFSHREFAKNNNRMQDEA